jgi:hypothetical protein
VRSGAGGGVLRRVVWAVVACDVEALALLVEVAAA